MSTNGFVPKFKEYEALKVFCTNYISLAGNHHLFSQQTSSLGLFPLYFFKYSLYDRIRSLNGLQRNGGRMQYRKFTKSLIFCDFDDVLKNPFKDVHVFLLHTLLSKKNSENHYA